MDIIAHSSLNTVMLDVVARAALGNATCGVSVGGGRSRIHLVNHNPPEQQLASDVLNHFGSLLLSADKTRLTAGAAAPVVRCADERIAADSRLAYLVLRDGAISAQGRVEVNRGQVALTLPALEVGIHDVFLYQLAGQFASGVLRIRVDPPQV